MTDLDFRDACASLTFTLGEPTIYSLYLGEIVKNALIDMDVSQFSAFVEILKARKTQLHCASK